MRDEIGETSGLRFDRRRHGSLDTNAAASIRTMKPTGGAIGAPAVRIFVTPENGCAEGQRDTHPGR